MEGTAGRALVALAVGFSALSGCSNPGYFVCTVDSECTEAENGRCEPSGACSIPDADCATGRRYGELGNPAIAGQCVPADDIGSTGFDAAEGSASVTSSTAANSSAGEESTAALSGSSGSTTGQGSTDGGSTGAGTSSSTGDAVPRDMWANCDTRADCSELCAPVVDLATLDPIGHWCTGFVCDDPVVDCSDPGTGATPDCLSLQLDGTLAPRCILDCTDTGSAGCPEGMECFEVFMSPSRCAHPVSE